MHVKDLSNSFMLQFPWIKSLYYHLLGSNVERISTKLCKTIWRKRYYRFVTHIDIKQDGVMTGTLSNKTMDPGLDHGAMTS